MTAPVTAVSTISSAAARQHQITKAAREFEAVLLNAFLGPIEKTFASLPGKDPDAISDNYQSLGMQAITSSIAAHGGLGFAAMIARSLSRRDSASSAAQEKSPARGASLARPF